MSRIILFSLFIIAFMGCSSNEKNENAKMKSLDLFDGVFNDSLANALKADDYGMKTYVMAFLKSGPNRSQDSAEAAALQTAHLKNITRMAENGDLVLAGPFLDDTELRGIYVFNVETIAEAEELTKSDPMIKKGALIFEFHPWYGTAVMPLINDIYKKVTKTEI